MSHLELTRTRNRPVKKHMKDQNWIRINPRFQLQFNFKIAANQHNFTQNEHSWFKDMTPEKTKKLTHNCRKKGRQVKLESHHDSKMHTLDFQNPKCFGGGGEWVPFVSRWIWLCFFFSYGTVGLSAKPPGWESRPK